MRSASNNFGMVGNSQCPCDCVLMEQVKSCDFTVLSNRVMSLGSTMNSSLFIGSSFPSNPSVKQVFKVITDLPMVINIWIVQKGPPKSPSPWSCKVPNLNRPWKGSVGDCRPEYILHELMECVTKVQVGKQILRISWGSFVHK